MRYTYEHKGGTKVTIKKTMSRKPVRRYEKRSDTQIAAQLDNMSIDNDDDDEDNDDIFDKRPTTKATLKTPSKISSKIDNTPAKNETIKKLCLRRSTDQSNYKIQSPEAKSPTRQRTLRPMISTPSRFVPGNKKVTTGPKQPTISRKNLNFNEKNEDKLFKKQIQISRSAKPTPANNNEKKNTMTTMTTRNNTKASTLSPTTPSRSTRSRTTRLSELNETTDMNKENKSKIDEEDLDVINRPKQETRRLRSTPQKQKTEDESMTTPRKSDNNYELKTPKSSRLARISEEIPKKTPRKLTQITEEPATPTTRRRKVPLTPKVSTLTPSMRQRTVNIPKPRTILEEARAQLHVSAVPKSLPCREQEFNDVFTFLQRKLLDESGGCIYISGVPGTGKTATVNEVIRCLNKLVTKDALADFNFVEINGMKLSEPRQAYVQILKQLTGKSAGWEEARWALEKRFTQRKKKEAMTLLLIDELDVLCNKRQDVVYNLLDWPSKSTAQLVVITIANTMDLPERVLMGRVTSRLGLTRLTFQPYNHIQLQEIVIARLKESEAFQSDAVQLVARKVAAVSGDARRALDICRRATEIAESYLSKMVMMDHVNEALSEMIASAKVRAIKACSELEKVFLQGVRAEISRTGVEETNFLSVFKQVEELCFHEGVQIPNATQGLNLCARLGAKRLLLCEQTKSDIHQRIFLNVSPDDIHFALQNVEY